jgi:hypothetical protein
VPDAAPGLDPTPGKTVQKQAIDDHGFESSDIGSRRGTKERSVKSSSFLGGNTLITPNNRIRKGISTRSTTS